jgi:hypothetical protein
MNKNNIKELVEEQLNCVQEEICNRWNAIAEMQASINLNQQIVATLQIQEDEYNTFLKHLV